MKLSPAQILIIREDAKKAFSDGVSFNACPYNAFRGSVERRQKAVWCMAWIEAKRDKEILDLVRSGKR